MANKQRGEVKIELGGVERTLKFTLNSLIYADDNGVDISAMNGENVKLKMKDLRTLLFAGLMHEDEELTAEAVGEMIEITNLQPITQALSEAFGAVGK